MYSDWQCGYTLLTRKWKVNIVWIDNKSFSKFKSYLCWSVWMYMEWILKDCLVSLILFLFFLFVTTSHRAPFYLKIGFIFCENHFRSVSFLARVHSKKVFSQRVVMTCHNTRLRLDQLWFRHAFFRFSAACTHLVITAPAPRVPEPQGR